MLTRPKRVAAIHDLSGFGRCSLAVILPILSVMGVQPVAVPTAVFSTHTGGFQNVVVRDLSDYITPTRERYQAEHITFEAVYTGFLGSQQQIDHCIGFIESYPDAYVLVDPVMGDNGKVYRTYTKELCNRMKELVRHADVITPNLTEMAILLGEDYTTTPMTAQQCKTKLLRLSELGPKTVVITGVHLADMTVNNVGYDSQTHSFWRMQCRLMPQNYPGTGDIFASILVGAMVNGDSLPLAMEQATRFLEIAIKATYSYGTDPRHGVSFEPMLSWLTEKQVLDRCELL